MTRLRSTIMVAGLSLAGALWAAPSFAQSCNEDMQKLGERRNTEMDIINGLIKEAKGKPLDPTVFCAKSAGLNAAETAMIAYLEKNKDWCQFPDQMVDQLKATHVKNVSFSAKACEFAAKIKKMKEQQADGTAPQAQPLPTGPL
jgi:hypothetical protein